MSDNIFNPHNRGDIISITHASEYRRRSFINVNKETIMSIQTRKVRSWLYIAFTAISVGLTQTAIAAESGPSQDWLEALYTQRIKANNGSLVQYYGKEGATKLHGLKKISCQNVTDKGSTQSCLVMVDITSFGLGRHKLNDRIVVRQTSGGSWMLISDVLN